MIYSHGFLFRLSLWALRHGIFLTQGYGVCTTASTSNPNRTVKDSSNSAIIKRFNHHSAMVLAAGSQKGYRNNITKHRTCTMSSFLANCVRFLKGNTS